MAQGIVSKEGNMLNSIRRLNTCLLVAGIVAAGFVAGVAFQSKLMGDFLRGPGRMHALFLNPSLQHLTLRNRLNSNNELARISSYYALRDYGLLDAAFLAERYGEEEHVFIKRVLLKMIAGLENGVPLYNLCVVEYGRSGGELKQEMLVLMRNNPNYAKFIEKTGIKTDSPDPSRK